MRSSERFFRALARKILPNGVILRVRISHKHGASIPKWLFHEMLRQAGLDEERFQTILRS